MGFESLRAAMAGCSCRYLDHTNKLIVLALANRANDDAIAWPSMPTLMRDCVFSSESAMRDRLRGLERIGLIETTPGTGRTSSRYRLNIEAIETHIDGSSVGDGSEPCPAKRKDEGDVTTASRTASSRRPGQRNHGAQDSVITAPIRSGNQSLNLSLIPASPRQPNPQRSEKSEIQNQPKPRAGAKSRTKTESAQTMKSTPLGPRSPRKPGQSLQLGQ